VSHLSPRVGSSMSMTSETAECSTPTANSMESGMSWPPSTTPCAIGITGISVFLTLHA
jgi:hypothetical protein